MFWWQLIIVWVAVLPLLGLFANSFTYWNVYGRVGGRHGQKERKQTSEFCKIKLLHSLPVWDRMLYFKLYILHKLLHLLDFSKSTRWLSQLYPLNIWSHILKVFVRVVAFLHPTLCGEKKENQKVTHQCEKDSFFIPFKAKTKCDPTFHSHLNLTQSQYRAEKSAPPFF